MMIPEVPITSRADWIRAKTAYEKTPGPPAEKAAELRTLGLMLGLSQGTLSASGEVKAAPRTSRPSAAALYLRHRSPLRRAAGWVSRSCSRYAYAKDDRPSREFCGL